MESWLDNFLIPLKVYHDKKMSIRSMKSRSSLEGGKILEQSYRSKEIEKELYAESIELRRSLLSSVEMAFSKFTIPQKYLMIFGHNITTDFSNIDEINNLKCRIFEIKKIEGIEIDVIDKIIIDLLLDHIESFTIFRGKYLKYEYRKYIL